MRTITSNELKKSKNPVFCTDMFFKIDDFLVNGKGEGSSLQMVGDFSRGGGGAKYYFQDRSFDNKPYEFVDTLNQVFDNRIANETVDPGQEKDLGVRTGLAVEKLKTNAKEISDAWDQSLLSLASQLVSHFIMKGDPRYIPANPAVTRGDLVYSNSKLSFEVTTSNFPLRDASNPYKTVTIPGTIQVRYVYNLDNKMFQLEHLETSNELLYKICMEEPSPLTEKELAELPSVEANEEECKFAAMDEQSGKLSNANENRLDQSLEDFYSESMKTERENLDELIRKSEMLPSDQSKWQDLILIYFKVLQRLEDSLNHGDPHYGQYESIFKEVLMGEVHPKIMEEIKQLRKGNTDLGNEFEASFHRLQVKATQPLINQVIQNIDEHGKKNFEDKSDKKKQNDGLVSDLTKSAKEFYSKPKFIKEEVLDFVNTFSGEIIKKERELNIPRHIWKPLMLNFAVGLTGVGLFVIIAKALYANFINPNASPYLFKTASLQHTEEAREAAQSLPKLLYESPESAQSQIPVETPEPSSPYGFN